jgi:hypothetical protein
MNPNRPRFITLTQDYANAHGQRFDDAWRICSSLYPTEYQAMKNGKTAQQETAIENTSDALRNSHKTALANVQANRQAFNQKVQETMSTYGWDYRTAYNETKRMFPALANTLAEAAPIPALTTALLQPMQIASLGLGTLDDPDEVSAALQAAGINLPPLGSPNDLDVFNGLVNYRMKDGTDRTAAAAQVRARHPELATRISALANTLTALANPSFTPADASSLGLSTAEDQSEVLCAWNANSQNLNAALAAANKGKIFFTVVGYWMARDNCNMDTAQQKVVQRHPKLTPADWSVRNSANTTL